MNPEKLWSRTAEQARKLTNTLLSSRVGRHLGLSTLTIGTLLLGTDSQANWQRAVISPLPGHTLSLTEGSHLVPAPDLNLASDIKLPESQILAINNITIPRGNGQMTLIYGADNNVNNSLNFQILLHNGATVDLARKLVPGILYPPYDQLLANRIRVLVVNPEEDIKCKQNALEGCDFKAIKREIDRTKAAGVIPHFTATLNLSNYWYYSSEGAMKADPFVLPYLNKYASFTVPDDPRYDIRLVVLAVAHGIGHLNGLADARLIPNSFTNVGDGYNNCSRRPLEAWSWAPTPFQGCESDPEAFINNPEDIMNDPGQYPFVSKENTAYLQRVLPRLLFAFLQPYTLEPMGNNFSVKQSINNQSIYQLQEMGFTLRADPPKASTCVEIKLTPAPNIYTGKPDGPAYDNIFCGSIIYQFGETGLNLPNPQIGVDNYFFLPGMTFEGELKVTNANFSIAPGETVPPEDLRWRWNYVTNPYTGKEEVIPSKKFKFSLPERFSDGIGLVTLAGGQTTSDLTPTLIWNNRDKDVFYYEVQLSKDPTFNNDPATATAPLYWELRHGGVTNPLNSYTVPDNFPLEKDKEYYWRVRPRIQGDGTPVAWSNPGTFKTSQDARVQTYSPELVDKDYGHGIIGPSQAQYDKANSQPASVQSELTIMREIKTDNSLTRILIPGTRQAVMSREEALALAA